MTKVLAIIILAATLAFHASTFACDATTPCDKCAKDSEMSWNPEKQFVTPRLTRFYALPDLIKSAYAANDYAAAGTLATEYLELANTYRCNWNYGNAVHDANRYLGLISLKKGDADAALVYLREAGKSTGSPQLDSFGPDLDLANELLKQGKTEAVQAYLKDIKKFWKMDSGQVAGWLAAIDAGEKPELDRFAVQQSVVDQALLLWLPFVWPALAVGITLFVLRKRIARKWIFIIVGLLAGYLSMIATNIGIAVVLPVFMGGLATFGDTMISFVLYASMAASIVVPTLVIVGLSRFFMPRKNAASPDEREVGDVLK